MSNLTVTTLSGKASNGNVIGVSAGHTIYQPGSIVQVVSVDNAGRYSQGFSANSWINVGGMSATITPKRSTSRILIMARWFGEMTDAGRVYNSVFGLTRNGTHVGRQTDPGATIVNGITMAALSYDGSDASSTPETANFFITDSPGSASELTYNVTFLSDGAGTLYTNRAVGWSNQTGGFELGTSSIVLMEIAQ